MRLVKKDLNKIPPSLKFILSKAKLAEFKTNKGLIDSSIYKGEYKDKLGKIQSRVREYLNEYYYEKCAYCEMHCKAEIEHYRPKKAVNEDKTHPGYYWLCYEWSNLLPSCRYCNTEGGKGNQFPIISKNRVNSPTYGVKKIDRARWVALNTPLIDEQAMLLHPEIDDPKNYLDFNISATKDGVEIQGKDSDNRGATTVKICNLNRSYLKLNRLESVHYNIKNKINQVLDLVVKGMIPEDKIAAAMKIVFQQLEEEVNNLKISHTLLRWFLFASPENFSNHFCPYIEDPKQREFVKLSFEQYKKGAL